MKGGNAAVYRGEPKQGKAGVTMTCSEELFIKMASGEVNGQQVRLKLPLIRAHSLYSAFISIFIYNFSLHTKMYLYKNSD